MSQLDPTVEISLAAAPKRIRNRVRVPGWVVLLLQNRKSRLGLLLLAFVVIMALIAPLISVDDPNGFDLLAARQSPSWNHLFGTTDQGSDIFSQVVLGARRSLLLGAAAAALATGIAALLGITAAYVGGLVDELVILLTNVFLLTAPPRPRGPLPHHGRLGRRARRRARDLVDERLPNHPADPAARRCLRLSEE